MTIIEAILLGIIQGLTEFFPVSSSGHLELMQYFLSLHHQEGMIVFDLICHLGTLLALMILFFDQIKQMIQSEKIVLFYILVAILPLFPLLLIMKPIKAFFHEPQYLGYGFLITSLLLFLGQQVRFKPLNPQGSRSWVTPLIVGIFQAFAIIPGISRSGATISAGRMLGWEQNRAITFSFLLAIPTILGGMTLEIFKMLKSESVFLGDIDWRMSLIGFLTSFIVGYIALKGLLNIVTHDKFSYFVWYCFGVGILTLLYFNFR